MNYLKPLSERAVLARLRQGKIRNSITDKRASEHLQSAFSCKRAKGQKPLFAESTRYKRVTESLRALEKAYKAQSAVWLEDGWRLVPAQKYMEFTTAMRPLLDAVETAARDFEMNYWTEVDTDMVAQGDLARPSDYPPDPTGLFKATLSFMPVPDTRDWRVDILPEDQARLDQLLQDAETNVSRDLLLRMLEPAKRLAARLGEYKGEKGEKWRESIVTNLTEVLASVDDLNLGDDPQVKEVKAALEAAVYVSHAPEETLKVSPQARQQAKQELDNILDKLQGFM